MSVVGAVLGPVYKDAFRSDTLVKWISDSELLIVLVNLALTYMISQLIEKNAVSSKNNLTIAKKLTKIFVERMTQM